MDTDRTVADYVNIAIVLAKRFMRHPGGTRKFSGIMSLVGVSLGVMLLIVVLAVLNGLADDLRQRILQTESHIRITPVGSQDSFDVVQVDSTVSRITSIHSVGRFMQGEVLLLHEGTTAGSLLYGVEFDVPGRRDELQEMIRPGGLSAGVPRNGLILGSLLARRLMVIPGDTVLLATPRELMPRPGGLPPRLEPLQLVALFESGLPEYDSALAFLPIRDTERILKDQGIGGVEIWLEEPSAAPRVSKQIRRFLKPASSFRVEHWGELNQSLFDALRLEKTAMFLVLALVIIIAALNIMGGILRNVMQRREDIAILMVMGCGQPRILSIFLLEGVLTGIVGASIGSMLGFVITTGIDASGLLSVPGDLLPFPSLPLVLKTMDFILVVFCTVCITTAAAIYPALRASRMNPVAIFHEL